MPAQNSATQRAAAPKMRGSARHSKATGFSSAASPKAQRAVRNSGRAARERNGARKFTRNDEESEEQEADEVGETFTPRAPPAEKLMAQKWSLRMNTIAPRSDDSADDSE